MSSSTLAVRTAALRNLALLSRAVVGRVFVRTARPTGMDKQSFRERVWDELKDSGEARFPYPP
jgi:hypothetical protein